MGRRAEAGAWAALAVSPETWRRGEKRSGEAETGEERSHTAKLCARAQQTLLSALLRVPATAPKQLLYPTPWSVSQWDLAGWACWNSFLSLPYPSGNLQQAPIDRDNQSAFLFMQFVRSYCSEWANVACASVGGLDDRHVPWRCTEGSCYRLHASKYGIIKQELLSFLTGSSGNL